MRLIVNSSEQSSSLDNRKSFVKDLRARPPSEVPVGHPARAGPGIMPSPARLTPVRTTSGAPWVRRCLTRGMWPGLRSTSDGYSAKFCHRPARLTLLRSTSGASSVRRCLTRGKGTGLRSTSDGPSLKFCHRPARLTLLRSTSGASSVRRCLTRRKGTGLRDTSDGFSAKFCQRPARFTPLRSTCRVPSPRRSRHYALTCAPHPRQNHF